MSMFCYQCEQTAKGNGCNYMGICGKSPEVAALQDLLIHATKGIAMYAHRAGQMGVRDGDVDLFTVEALFSTVTNVDFDPERLQGILVRGAGIRDKAKLLYEQACKNSNKNPETLGGPAAWVPASDLAGLVKQGEDVSIEKRKAAFGDDIAGLQELVTYGLKGTAAYADHARVLGVEDGELYAAFQEVLNTLTNDKPAADELLALSMRVGGLNMKAMQLLDAANVGAYGSPTPTAVRVQPLKGKAILVSGHDLKDLEELLKQTDGKGINVYTHGEMLPAHGYPQLNAYKHLAGNYGGAWQDQAKEFDDFPGAMLITTNCIQKPRDSYMDRVFTSGLVAWPGVTHIDNRDFSPVIDAAMAAEGFAEDAEDKTVLVGFGHDTVMGVADKVIDAVKTGAIKRFFLIGGCDGAKSGRNYYTELAESIPDDCVILTLACGKYRFNKLEFGDIGGIPRLLDVGQCNDAYSAIQIAVALAGAFECEVNELPLSFVLSWYEQKAVAILLTLLSLGIKNIRLGPSLPAFLTPNLLNALVEKFNIMPITSAEADLQAMLA